VNIDPVTAAADARAAAELDRLTAETRKQDETLSEAQAFEKALTQRPELYEPATRHWAAAVAREVAAWRREEEAAIAKASEPRTPAERAVEQAADVVQRRQPDLTREQAYAKALEERPELYEAHLEES
jgi:hypothetical protein